jgi:hypothetical protein
MQLQGKVSLRYFCFDPTRDESIQSFCAGSPSYSLFDPFVEFGGKSNKPDTLLSGG